MNTTRQNSCTAPIMASGASWAERQKGCQFKMLSAQQEGGGGGTNFWCWQKQFVLIKDPNEIWRCGGHLQNASISNNQPHSILLDKDNDPFTQLLQ